MSCVCLLLLLCFGKSLGAPLSVDTGAMVSVGINLSIDEHVHKLGRYCKLGKIVPICLSLHEALRYCTFMRQVVYSDID
jgi:hypothetical protein